jgi:hypothetical protein
MNFISPKGSFYEKSINIRFYEKIDSDKPALEIVTANNNFKPRIDLSGSLITNTLFAHMELRIMNGHISFDKINYQRVVFDAGYQDSNTGALTGRITHAYVESPGPDGVTVFFILMGEEIFNTIKYEDKTKDRNGNAYGNVFYFENETRNATYGDIISYFSRKIQNNSFITKINVPSDISNMRWHTPIQLSGSAIEIFQKLINGLLGLSYTINGTSVNVYSSLEGSNASAGYKIERFSSTPRVNVQDHINFQSPWIPGLRPGDYIAINPGYMKTTFGGYQTTQGQSNVPLVYIVLKIDFDFSTTENTNVMVVDCIAPSVQVTVEE